ncbi:hypothetical protein HK102_013947 [Quaeritorhiza haematococci]|nr:hypothetical protein HK102_013947 [Quaeritorhiza haematococci]
MSRILNTKLPKLDGIQFVKGDENAPLGLSQDVPSDKRRVLVLEFWATWCGPCRSTIPHLSALQKKFKDKDVYFVGITDERDRSRIENFVQGMGTDMDYHVAIDGSLQAKSKVFAPSGARGIPHVFLIDAENTIVWAGHPMEPEFEQKLNALAAIATKRTGGGGEQKKEEALPPVTESYEELMKHSVKDLKRILEDRKIDHRHCVEKSELANLIVELQRRKTSAHLLRSKKKRHFIAEETTVEKRPTLHPRWNDKGSMVTPLFLIIFINRDPLTTVIFSTIHLSKQEISPFTRIIFASLLSATI